MPIPPRTEERPYEALAKHIEEVIEIAQSGKKLTSGDVMLWYLYYERYDPVSSYYETGGINHRKLVAEAKDFMSDFFMDMLKAALGEEFTPFTYDRLVSAREYARKLREIAFRTSPLY